METAKALDIPFFRELIPGGIEYGSTVLVEFEPQSCWYEAANTIAVQALRSRLKTDLHIFQHNPKSVRDAVSRAGIDVKKMEGEDLLRFIDSYSVQIGVNAADIPKGADAFKTSSVKLEDWARAAAAQISQEIPPSEKNRLHIDDNTAVLTRYNKEDDVIDYWRTRIIPLYKTRESILINAVALGVASDTFYRQNESMADGIIDCRSQEEDGVVEHYIRVRMFRGRTPDSRWQHVKLADGQVFLESGRRKPSSLGGEGQAGERRLAAIMFTDTVGSTAMAQKDEALALELLQEQRDVVRPLLREHRGREIKTTGDGFLVEFASALDAVRCAVAIQSALGQASQETPQDRRLLVRIGIHLGDVIHVGSDVAGDAVNVASRIEPLAGAGGVSLSGQVYGSVMNRAGVAFESIGTPQLKGVDTPIEVYRVVGLGESKPVVAWARPREERMAILPLRNISPDPNDEYFADGMTEELISAVSRIGGLRVIARTSVMKYKGSDKSMGEIGRELNVGTVLQGSVRKAGDKIRITVQLVGTSDEELRWSHDYDRELKDVFAIQSDISRLVAGALRADLAGGGASESKATSNMDAYVEYLRGRQLWGKLNADGLRGSLDHFRKALELDPSFARAHAGLADSYAWMAILELMASREAFSKAKESAERALSIDPDLAEARTSLALIRFQYDWDWGGAEEEFRQAVAIKPSYALAHRFFSDYLKAMGRFGEALDEIKRAKELDPLSVDINSGLGHVLYLSRDVDEAIVQYRKTVELDPGAPVPHIWFGRPYLEKGMYPEAIAELETAVKLTGGSTLALAMLGHVLGSAGREEEAKAVLTKLLERSEGQYVASYWIAQVYNGMKDRANAVAWLKKAFDERSAWLVWANVEPRFDWLRADPEFSSLMKAMKFP